MADSFLFSGISFDRKRFAKDISRFKGKKDTVENPNFLDNVNVETKDGEQLDVARGNKKRKRKLNEHDVKSFSVFKRCNRKPKNEEDDHQESEISQGKKEYFRQLEVYLFRFFKEVTW
ncbi:hypothetical protein Leryth_000883 [Lithospermum erythrorhizon]|nr:hypothetical protein Leryth_000883 [Lithospermum erythrorhizon]